jgi:hypothetical protein
MEKLQLPRTVGLVTWNQWVRVLFWQLRNFFKTLVFYLLFVVILIAEYLLARLDR